MIKNKKNLILIIIIFLLEIIILFNSKVLITSSKEALSLFINKLFISLFPFFILNKILINYNLQSYLSNLKLNIINKILNIDNTGLSIIIVSSLTGMPSNAEYIKDLLEKRLIDLDYAERLLLITFFPSPVFVITVVGYLYFKSIKIGIILLLLVYLSNFLIASFNRNKYKITYNKNTTIIKSKKFMACLKDSITSSINSLTIILGNLIIFSILLGIINNYIKLPTTYNSIISSILELTNGIKKVSEITNFNLKFTLTLFALNFSGLSIYSQMISILSDYKINFKKIFVNRLVFTNIFSLIIYILLIISTHLSH